MRTRAGRLLLSAVALIALASLPVHAQDAAAPPAIAGYLHELVAPGVWRLLGDGTDAPLDQVLEVSVGPDGSVWLLTSDGAFELGTGMVGPSDRPVDRLLGVDADGRVWLRFRAADREGIGTWDGSTWTEITGPRRLSALEPDPEGAPGVIRDFALGPDGAVWVVAGEQDGPRWQRFTVERLDEDGWTSWAIDDGLPTLRCGKNCGDGSRVVALDDGSVWVSVDQGGLLRFDGGAWEVVRPLGDVDRPVSALLGKPRGMLWADLVAGPGGRTRARFDGSAWSVPAAAQPGVGTSRYDLPVAVGPDGRLWMTGRAVDQCLTLWALDSEGRRSVRGIDRHADRDVCPRRFLSLSVGPDGLVWLIVAPADRSGEAGHGVDLLVIDPAIALVG